MEEVHAPAPAYHVDGRPAGPDEFTRIACDPSRSVVVEACAGSGKTWLLVARALRLLLSGAKPAELLAITFTRKAAQEMHTRLMSLLQELALAPADAARRLLAERGMDEREIDGLMPAARKLYERVLSNPHPLSFDTFHGWFSRLLKIAPLGSGVPLGYALAETTGDLRAEAHRRFMHGLGNPDMNEIRNALKSLYERIGDTRTHELLDCFVDKRAEWWAAKEQGDPLEWLADLCGEDALRDARLDLWSDASLLARVKLIAEVLGKGSKDNQERAARIAAALDVSDPLEAFPALLQEFCDDKGNPRGNYYNRKDLIRSAQDYFGSGVEGLRSEFEAVAAALRELQERSADLGVIEVNRCLFLAGEAYLESYQSLKTEKRVLDFTDLEWHAYRLMSDGELASYLQARLDARYRHILLDEFQDTNPLQWCVLRSWLEAYGTDASPPSVFIVGDPKQSIYRFRRADPRVFDAAQQMLRAQGAAMLRTDHTRRNATRIVDVLNLAMDGNPRYSRQSTASMHRGEVWRLPLAANTEKKTREEFFLRDPLMQAAAEDEDTRRLEEGRRLAAALHSVKMRMERTGEKLCWKDVMLLVRKRTHLEAYESALREAGIPFVSDRRGGLLDSLEALDFIALLSFLAAPCDDLALAHVLKSPLMAASDDDLIALAKNEAPTWYDRLARCANLESRPALERAYRLLARWIEYAPHLPVHDLLDRILHEGEALPRYARTAALANRGQVMGNIEAFIALSLSMDGGRYPSLQKFIHELSRLRKTGGSESPDEASVDAASDAVRILTVHSAKGLESRVVGLLDANHSQSARDNAGILCDWPQSEIAPVHFSAFGSMAERGLARGILFAEEEKLHVQEDWNLLYVAVTRAKEMLLVSGVSGGKSSAIDGVSENSWYARLAGVPELEPDHIDNHDVGGTDNEFFLNLFAPPPLESPPPAISTDTAAIADGIALHALLERLTLDGVWPIRIPDTDVISRWIGCPASVAERIGYLASRIMEADGLKRFFDKTHYVRAFNELDIMTEEGQIRLDRLIIFSQDAWILDYKLSFSESETAAYLLQLKRYGKAVRRLFPKLHVRGGVVTAERGLTELPI